MNNSTQTPGRPVGKAIIWTVAGSDCSGGAGLQADLRAITGLGSHACTIVSAVTSQNSQAVTNIEAVDIDSQLSALASDMPAHAIKIGMLANRRQVISLAAALSEYKQTWAQPPVIIYDPVLSASSGEPLSLEDITVCIAENLLPCVDVLTPNAVEATHFTGINITDQTTLEAAALKMLEFGCRSVVIKGGHTLSKTGCARDYYTDGTASILLDSPSLKAPHNHGTGCLFSSVLATCLAQKFPIQDALVLAKAYVTRGLKCATRIGSGPGPVAHTGWPCRLEDFPVVGGGNHFKQPFASCETMSLNLYPVVDSAAWIEKLLSLGVKTIQLRIKDASKEKLNREIAKAVASGRRHKARVFINDHWQLALKHEAYGVHLGQEDIGKANLKRLHAAGLRLGISSHGYYEMLRAHNYRPSYIAIGAIYPTTTKVMPSNPQGLSRLRRYIKLMKGHYPLVAIGGITLARAPQVWQQKPGSIAMVTTITKAPDYKQAVEALFKITGEVCP
jgi:hydroxymethylpyrimidine kinase/phosphomethylpyrimidine kinase/thiamine-phosphate diphosphorylase